MNLFWKWMSHSLNGRQRSIFASLCLFFSLSSCVALDPQPIKVANNSASATSQIEESPESSDENTPRKQLSAMDDSDWEKHKNSAKDKNTQTREEHKPDLSQLRRNFGVKNRMSLTTVPGSLPMNLAGKKYSYQAEDTNIQFALKEFANKYNLNMFIDQDIDGDISVNFKNLALKKAMQLMLGTHNYYWAWNNDLIRVSRLQTKVFVIDYLRLTRTGQAASSSSIFSKIDKSESDNERSSTSIQQNDNLAFWEELETQLSSLVSDQGRFVVNRLSGTVQITDVPLRVIEVETFISSLQDALHRQVEIDARIIEVTLRDDNALGIDWNAISIKGIAGSLTNTVTGSNQGLGLKANTLSIGYNHDNFSALISALEEQGSIRVVSQPRIRIINNQPALIKVGTDRTFFTQSVNRLTNLNGQVETVITEDPTTVTEGLVLSVTPQISKDRWIMLDISPVITRVVEVTTSPQGSTAPVLDVKQASTLIRAKDSEMVILGGLIQQDNNQTDRQVPFFAQLPVIGKMFEGEYSTNIKKELVIFLVPRLVI